VAGDPAGSWLAFAHATGFCKEVWIPVADEIPWKRALAWDAPGHGDAAGFSPPADWWDFARYALDVLAPIDSRVVGVGHSMGGATLLMAELLQPGRFDGLIVIEPVIFPPPYERMEDVPLAEGALRRRDGFTSRDAILENYRGKEPFASWDPAALDAYIDGGFVEHDGRWWLKCRPDVEAEVYRAATAHGLYARLGEVGCPVLVVAGEYSTTFTEPFIADIAGRMQRARYQIVAGASHFVPMERPKLVAETIASFLAP
jgi:pimeloyl-ACP methyl ester carboxylesterase